jgi:type II secretory pathway predicted ATPase ExeA
MTEGPFHLRRRAFPATPDSSCYYPATSHERALTSLQQGLADGEGVLLLTGPPGTGKTLLCHCLLDRLGAGVGSAFLSNSHVRDRAALLQAILFDLALPHEGRPEQDLRLALTGHLLEHFAAGRPTLLLVDEAQHLPPDALEELRLLGNLEARTGKAVQVVLVGQPALREALARPELATLRQRLAVRAALEPLGLQEAADYLLHHLRVAGARPERALNDEALELLARNTQGVPRLLNQAGHRALALAAEAGAAEVDAEVALEALASLGLPGESSAGPAGAMLVEDDRDEPGEGVVLPLSADGAAEGAAPRFVTPSRPA